MLRWLLTERIRWRSTKRQALDALIKSVQPKLDRTDSPTYRCRDWQIGTGMIESTARQLVGLRLKGPGRHWSPAGPTAMTALRTQDLNGYWHTFWKSLTLANGPPPSDECTRTAREHPLDGGGAARVPPPPKPTALPSDTCLVPPSDLSE